jgi:hypothetical protein
MSYDHDDNYEAEAVNKGDGCSDVIVVDARM